MTAAANKFSSIIIGSGTLPVRCAEILLRAGHEICGIVSDDRETLKWCAGNEIKIFQPGYDLAGQIEKPFDYLFSIVNERILENDVLKLPRKMAINYHDAPLPRYAGTHATSWALLNAEQAHGVTWHVIAELVDAGDILKQRNVRIAANDTALTLNTKCYEAAAEAFEELVEDISLGRLAPTPQDLRGRTFFPRFKRPDNGGVISWASTSSEISALIRALDFGPHPNPLGTAKVLLGDNYFVVSGVEIAELSSASPPGTVRRVGPDFVQVCTADSDVILRDFRSLRGEPIPVSTLAADFGLREGYELTGPRSDVARKIEDAVKATCRKEAFWVRKLSDLETVALPLVSGVSDSPEHRSVIVQVPEELTSTFAGAGNIEVYLTAAFGAFVSRLTGTDRIDIGFSGSGTRSPVAGAEPLFSPCVPLRIEVERYADFSKLLGTAAAEIETVTKNGTFAWDAVQRYPQLGTYRSSASGPRFPIVVVTGAETGRVQPPVGDDLTFEISEGNGEHKWTYDSSRFNAEDVARLAGNFSAFLKGIAVAEPGVPLAELPLMDEDELHRVLIGWNSSRIEVPAGSCIHHLFEDQVQRTPDSVALVAGEERVTYKELNARAAQLARHLRSLGVGPEVLAAVCLPRSVELVVSILAVLKAGGAYVPLDPAYPKTRLEHILKDSRASVLLARGNAAWEPGDFQGEIVNLDLFRERAEQPSGIDPAAAPVHPGNLAYVIYTSGSTGKPKGVAIEHRSAVAFLSWATSVFGVERLKGTLASTSVCFDLSVFEMFAPLICGGSVIMVENILHLPGSPAAGQVTLINTVPSAIAELVRVNGIPASVRTVNLAGEPLKTSLVKQIYETGTVREVFDLYGPSEDTTYSTYTLRDTGKATIGRPIANTQAYILDRDLQPLPVGVPGELYLSGDGLARGYLHQPELTAERFVSNPFARKPGERMYRTGDLVRYQPSGTIEYLGRIDHQVKIRGFRIELGEIEAVIGSHPGVAECVVAAREDQPGEKRLVAYFVSSRGRTTTAADIRDHIKARLPDYMLPSAFIELNELPLTPNGKIDRKALPAPPSTPSGPAGDFVAHRDDLESRLVSIWEEVLNIRPIGVTDNFFELGGHSLKAIRMFAEVEEVFGKNIPLATLFEAGTIEKLASILRQEGWAAPESSLVPIQPNGTKPPFFCIHAKGGNVLFYRDLAKYLSDDQPFYGLQARRLAGRQIGHATVEEMAEFYIKEMRSLQPEGPYYVGGSSFGGLVAFEIAQQLKCSGERVALLALLDTGTPDYPKMLPNTSAFRTKAYRLFRRAQQLRDNLSALSSSGKAVYVVEKLKKVKLKYRRKVRDRYKNSVRAVYRATKGAGAIPASYIQIEDLIRLAGLKYQPTAYAGDVTLFRASIQPLGIYPDATLGWEPFVHGKLEIHEVPGHHGSIVAEPYVRVLGAKLRNCLETVQLNEARQAENELRPNRQPHELIHTAAAGRAIC